MKKHSINIRGFFSENRLFTLILFTAMLARIILFFQHHEIWWDSGVYIGMGKYIFSLGKAGLWEHIRPVLWPLTLGAGWKLGLNPIIFGRVIELLLSAASITLAYLISKQLFGRKTAVIASAMLSFSTIFFYLGFHLYTEIPATFLVLLAVYLFINGRYYLSGAGFGLAFLTKYPTPIFFAAAGLALLPKMEIKKGIKLCMGFATPIAPFLFISWIFYGSFLSPILDASATISKVLGCNVLRYQPWHHYLYKIIADNPLNAFCALGIYQFFRKYKPQRLIILLCLAVPLAYFSQMHCREYRYLMMFIPFAIILSASGISQLIRKKKYFFPCAFIVLAVSASIALVFYAKYNEPYIPAKEGYYRFLEGKETSLEVWASDPVAAAYSDLKISKIYYPVYDRGVSTDFNNYIFSNSGSIGYVLIDNCGGGMICEENDWVCENNTQSMADFLETHFKLEYSEMHGRCYYKIYVKG